MPYIINSSESYQIGANLQGLFSQPIEIDGELDVEGILIEVGVSQNAESSQIYFDNSGTFYGNTGFTFNITSGNVDIPGNVNPTGNIIPSGNVTYDLGIINTTMERHISFWVIYLFRFIYNRRR